MDETTGGLETSSRRTEGFNEAESISPEGDVRVLNLKDFDPSSDILEKTKLVDDG